MSQTKAQLIEGLNINTSAPADALVIDSSGNVGIGVASPARELSIGDGSGSPNIQLLASSSGNSRIEFGDSGDSDVGEIQYVHSSNYMQFTTNGSERLRINSSGNVGIGTTAPSKPFVVSSATSPQVDITNPGVRSYRFGVDSNSKFQVFETNTSRITLDSSGNVGIGTSSPGRDLDVVGSIRSGGSTNPFYALADGTTEAYFEIASSVTRLSSGASQPLVLRTGSAERLRINSSGNVGIGTSSPLRALTIAKTGSIISGTGNSFSFSINPLSSGYVYLDAITGGSANTSLSLRTYNNGTYTQVIQSISGNETTFETAGTERMRIDSSGNVGIGTSTIEANTNYNTLEIAGDTSSGGAVVRLKTGDRSTAKTMLFCDTGGFEARVETNHPAIFSTNNTERMRIDSSGNVGIGESSIDTRLHIKESTTGATGIFIQNSNGATNSSADLFFGNWNGSSTTTPQARIQAINTNVNTASTDLIFYTYSGSSTLERMRITSGGSLLIGQTNESFGTNGHIFQPDGAAYHIRVSNPVLLLNRQTSDGEIVRIAQDGNTEGTISVSGSTVSYNGGHLARWSQLPSGAARTEILRGSVLSNLDEMCEWGEENNEQLNRMKVSDVEGDVNVSGVFQAWDDDDDTYTNDFYCAMTGDFVIRIAQGTTVARGDLLMSAGDGTAKPQDDDIVRSKTIAKVTSTTVSITYADGSYCVPCVLMAC